MDRPENANSASRLVTLASVALVVAALYLAKEVLLPFALAVLLSFLLSPVVVRLERFKLGRVPSVIVVTGMAFVAVLAIGWVVTNQFIDLTANLPKYKENLIEKGQALRGPMSGTFKRAVTTITEISNSVLGTEDEATGGATAGPAAPNPASPGGETSELKEQPVPVKVVEGPPTPVSFLSEWLGSLLAPLGQLAIVVVFVIFMLIQREDLRNRLIRLIGAGSLPLTTEALDDAASRVSRYLLMQLIINATYGMAVAAGLFAVGMPNAVLWGLLATILRFIPYIGPWIAAVMPIALSLAVFDGWLRPLVVIGLFVVLELVSNNIMEPLLYGSSTGMSPVGIIASAVFWTWLWGGLGLVMATPLTVCLTVLGRYIPQLRFVNILLSDEPVLTIESRYYQRLLALDQDEATNLVDDFLKSHSVEELYDAMILPALRLAERDRHAGNLPETRQRFIYGSLRDLVEELGESQDAADVDSADAAHPLANHPVLFTARQEVRIVCLPATDEADEIAGTMLAQALAARGYHATCLSLGMLTSERLEQVKEEEAGLVVISALPPGATAHARYVCKRLRPAFPDLKIIVGLWIAEAAGKKITDRLTAAGADEIATTLSQATDQIERLTATASFVQQNGNRSALPSTPLLKSS
jgi:predicted PurR-regulated permease PerM